MHSLLRKHIDFATQQFFKFKKQGGLIKKATDRLEINQQIDVAAWPIISPGYRSKHADVIRAVSPSDS